MSLRSVLSFVDVLPVLAAVFLGNLFGMPLLQRVAFFPSLAYNLAAERLTSRKWYNRLDDHVILGALPFRSVFAKLRKHENLRGVISFNEDYELNSWWYPSSEEYQRAEVEFLQLPVRDFTAVPTWEQVDKALDFVERIGRSGGTVYVHCKAGRFRSAYFATAYVIKTRKLDAANAVKFVQGKRSQIWLGDKELESLQTFYNRLHPERPEGEITKEVEFDPLGL